MQAKLLSTAHDVDGDLVEQITPMYDPVDGDALMVNFASGAVEVYLPDEEVSATLA